MFSYGNMFLKSLVLVFLLIQNTGLKVVKPVKPMPRVSLVVDSNRKNCSGGLPDGDQPPNRANTSAILILLYSNYYIIAIIQQSEYVADADKRREYVSGFTGSAGTAVILSDGQRALWTDGRYFLQADDQLDCNWILMRSGNDGVPTIAEWIISELGPGTIVSIDARLIGYDTWLSFGEDLSAHDIVLYPDQILDGNNLVDLQWNEDGRPAYSLDPIFTLAVEYTEWYDKIFDIKEKMDSNEGDVLVLTTLDEIAWTLNLRGSDIPFNPESFRLIQSYRHLV
ncbi:putative Xaa-Pro aminopeptidase P [Armadillidium nasatum]|uniref:Putative Xaa-Pro aminopeptidase P n=1 Tax=Armadillidium nasatum TaxID=96803 RepID=A0A5N5SZ91_9CRUS|nr:putative Xaa-Pro aminopeptidase P [Armadillidium nasatum]